MSEEADVVLIDALANAEALYGRYVESARLAGLSALASAWADQPLVAGSPVGEILDLRSI